MANWRQIWVKRAIKWRAASFVWRPTGAVLCYANASFGQTQLAELAKGRISIHV